MLRSVRSLSGYKLRALDGIVGQVQALLFDVHDWNVHDLVVDAENWTDKDQLLISPGTVRRIAWVDHSIQAALTRQQVLRRQPPRHSPADKLHSTDDLVGYRIYAHDGEVGKTDDFIIDDQRWALRYIVVDANHLMPGRAVLIAPQWTMKLNDSLRQLHVDLSLEAIQNCPEYHRRALIGRDYEEQLYDYYGRLGYWDLEPPHYRHQTWVNHGKT